MPPTQVTDDWANAVQEELCHVIEEAGITLNKASNTQLRAAIQSMVLGSQSVQRYIQTYSGDGSEDEFTLPVAPPSVLACTAWVDGDVLRPGIDFTVDGDVLTFATPPSNDTDNVTVLIEGAAQEVISQFSAGMAMFWPGTSAPTGWLLCDGSAVSRSTYAALYSQLGTTFGSGDGSTTFNLPDARGRALVGLDNMGGSPANVVAALTSVGGTGGAATVTPTGTVGNTTLTTDQIPAHGHSIDFYSGGSAFSGTSNYFADRIGGYVGLTNTASGSKGTATSSIQSSGGGQSHTHTLSLNAMSVLAPYLGMAVIIKT